MDSLVLEESVRPDLSKFHHYGVMLKNFGLFERVHLVFGKIFKLRLVNFIYYRSTFHCKWPIMTNNLSIWSHY